MDLLDDCPWIIEYTYKSDENLTVRSVPVISLRSSQPRFIIVIMSSERPIPELHTLISVDCQQPPLAEKYAVVDKCGAENIFANETKVPTPKRSDSRFSRANRWRAFHKESARLTKLAHSLGKTSRERMQPMNSTISVANLETGAANLLSLNRSRSQYKLQRENVVYSETHSGVGSKTPSYDSTRSDGAVAGVHSMDKMEHLSVAAKKHAPSEIILPALTLTLPAEDVMYSVKKHTNVGVGKQTTNNENNSHLEETKLLCTRCLIMCSDKENSSQLTQRSLPSSPTRFRRYSHCLTPTKPEGAISVYQGEEDSMAVCHNCRQAFRRKTRVNDQSLYPPTRNRNVSCSGLDMLADAILHARLQHKDTTQQQLAQNPKQDRMTEGVCPMGTVRSKPLIPRSTRMMALKKFKNFGRDLMDSRPGQLSATSAQPVRTSKGTARPGHLSATSAQPVRTSKGTAPILRLPNDAENTVRKAGETYLTSGEIDQLRVKRSQFQQGLAANSFELNSITPSLAENPHPILKTRSTDSAKEILLSVPGRLAPLAKRRSTPSEELPLDSRIRRVSMILMSRHTLPYTDSRIQIVEPKSSMGSGNSLKDDTALNPALTTSSSGWKYNGVVRQDTDNWSLLSAPKGESPISLPKRSPEVTFPQMASIDSCAGRREINLRKNKKARRPTDRFSKGIGYHLGRRRHLLERRRRMADFALAFGIFGILAALLDTESIACGWYKQTSFYSLTVRILISLSTVVLMTLIISYHAYDVM
ncbi:hypothetical protein CSKR_202266, partial [Clonorchis sinensis]